MLAMTDFRKIIDLTAPKEEREPDISTEMIWRRSKEEVFKGKTYRTAPDEKQGKFREKMSLKPMPASIRDKISEHVDKNVNSFHIRTTNSAAMSYQKYDPFTYKGLDYH